MRKYAVEVTYHGRHYKHVIVEAEDPEDACEVALETVWEVTKRVRGVQVIKVDDDHMDDDEYVTDLWVTEDPGEDPKPGKSPTVEVPERFAEPMSSRRR